jgi:hypothetical protein
MKVKIMLRCLKEILGYTIDAEDGKLGKVNDFLFDDGEWTIRYLVADTGGWLTGRKVLLSPSVLGIPDWVKKFFPVALSKQNVKDSPEIDTDKPISRRQEEELHAHYRWVRYWDSETPAKKMQEQRTSRAKAKGDPNLRSVNEVLEYAIRSSECEGEIGHVGDFILDDEHWILRYIVVDTDPWLPGRKVLISPHWIEDIRWPNRSVQVVLTRDQVKNSPEYIPFAPVNCEYEQRLYDYYGRPSYWE